MPDQRVLAERVIVPVSAADASSVASSSEGGLMSNAPGVPPVPAVPSLYEWAGGLDMLTRLMTRFYTVVPNDPILAPVFASMPSNHATHVAHFLSEVLGGPGRYSTDIAEHPP